MTSSAATPELVVAAAKLWLTTPRERAGAEVGDAPYLATALYAVPLTVTSEVPTASADVRWRLYANPDWLLATDVPAVAAELAHLTWHLLRDHAGRAASLGVGTRESAAWRTAADTTVAETLDDAGHDRGHLPLPVELGLRPQRPAEEHYAALTRLAAPAPEPGDSDEPDDTGCGSAADGLPRGYEVRDDEVSVDPTRAEQIRRAVAIDFRDAMGRRGTEPGEWARWVQAVLEPRLPWQQLLPSAVRRAIGWTTGATDYTYSRPSRRRAASPHVVLPGMRRPAPSVAVVVDTSGSMDDGLLAQALGEVDGVLRSLGPAGQRVTVLSCDAAVHTVSRTLHARDLRLVGGGGTDLAPGIAAAAALRPRPEVLVLLTDGDTPWPPAPPPGCAVVAAVLSRDRAARCVTPPWVARVDCVL